MTPIPALSQSLTEGMAAVAVSLPYMRAMPATTHGERHHVMRGSALCVRPQNLCLYKRGGPRRGQS